MKEEKTLDETQEIATAPTLSLEQSAVKGLKIGS
jgi:hypothetical protein